MLYGTWLLVGTHYKYSREDIEKLISQAKSIVRDALRNPLPNAPSAITRGMWMSQLTDLWLIHALDHYGVERKNIVSIFPCCYFESHVTTTLQVVFGSTSPWYESLGTNYCDHNRAVNDTAPTFFSVGDGRTCSDCG